MEVWKDIPGYEGYYQASSEGRIRSLDRNFKVMNVKGFYQTIHQSGRILKPLNGSNGYLAVNLSKENVKKIHRIHRLVALAFLPNPDNLPEVNHKDENIKNNALSNLEWCTSKYNSNYGTRNQRLSEMSTLKAVVQLTKDGQHVKKWKSITEASRGTGIDMSQISGVCRHKKEYVTAGGYKWEYAN